MGNKVDHFPLLYFLKICLILNLVPQTCSFSFGCTVNHVGSYSHARDLIQHPLRWKSRALRVGKTPLFLFLEMFHLITVSLLEIFGIYVECLG